MDEAFYNLMRMHLNGGKMNTNTFSLLCGLVSWTFYIKTHKALISTRNMWPSDRFMLLYSKEFLIKKTQWSNVLIDKLRVKYTKEHFNTLIEIVELFCEANEFQLKKVKDIYTNDEYHDLKMYDELSIAYLLTSPA